MTFEEEILDEFEVKIGGMIDDKIERSNAREFVFSALSKQKEMIRGEVEKLIIQKPVCDCRSYAMGEHNCDYTSIDAINGVLKILFP